MGASLLATLVPAQRSEQSTRRGLTQIENLLEALGAAVVRVRHFIHGRTLGVFEEQLHFRHATDGLQLLQRRQILAVHGQQQIKVVEILRRHLARAQGAQLVTTLAGGGNRPAVRRAANMPISGAGGIDAAHPALPQGAFPLSESAKHTLGRRRTTDIAKTDEEDLHGRALPAGKNPFHRQRIGFGVYAGAGRFHCHRHGNRQSVFHGAQLFQTLGQFQR